MPEQTEGGVVKANSGHLSGAVARIRSVYPSLPPSEQKVADHIISDPEKIIYMSVTQLADGSGVGESTVIRFCQKVGFKGYQELKLVLAKDLAYSRPDLYDEIRDGDDLATMAEKVAYINSEAIKETNKVIDFNELERAVEALVKARRVVFFGVGASANTGSEAKYKFLRVGIQVDALKDPHMQAMTAATLHAGDVVVGISHSGSTKDVVDSVRLGKEAGATAICITNFARSPLAQLADIVLLTATEETPLGSGALRSKIAQLHVMDLLYTGVVMRINDQAARYTDLTAKAVSDKLY